MVDGDREREEGLKGWKKELENKNKIKVKTKNDKTHPPPSQDRILAPG